MKDVVSILQCVPHLNTKCFSQFKLPVKGTFQFTCQISAVWKPFGTNKLCPGLVLGH